MSRRSKACDFSKAAREKIRKRDNGRCIFCQLGYQMPPEEFTASNELQIMHFVPRSQGGLGIPENGALGCIYHHTLLDNGRDTRDEMINLFEAYLRVHYSDWSKEKLIYDKWSFLKGGK